MLDIPFTRKVLEFVENTHPDFVHEQAAFFMTPEIASRTGLYLQGMDSSLTFREQFGADCKTAACIAGTACMLDPDTDFDKSGCPTVGGESVNWSHRAADLMGLDRGDASELFWEMDEQVAIARLRGILADAEKKEAENA